MIKTGRPKLMLQPEKYMALTFKFHTNSKHIKPRQTFLMAHKLEADIYNQLTFI